MPLNAADIDVSEKPEPLAKKDFEFPEYQIITLDNGIQTFVIEDDEQPTFAMRILIPGGSSIEGDKPGVAELTASMMTKGAAGKSSFEIARKLDGVGADISVSASDDYIRITASALKKHMPTVFETLNDIITKPDFPQEEFDKLIKQAVAGIQYEKSEPRTMANKLARKVIYGELHPYAQAPTEESIKEVTLEDIKEYYSKYIIPNKATISVIGDVNPSEMKSELETALAGWEKGKPYEINIPDASPMAKGVYFIKRPGSVQSIVSYHTKGVRYGHPDYEELDMAANVIGAGFAGRLFRILREEYSYTYTPFGYLTGSKYANRFSCGADVRNSVTDSALTVIIEQVGGLADSGPEKDELERVKNYIVGSYLMNFESSEFIASLVQDADFYGIPIGKVKNYPDRAADFSIRQIRKVAEKYISPDDMRLVVVGAPDVADKLDKFGPVFYYNLDLERETAATELEEVSLDAEELIEKYVDAIGGRDAIDAIKTIEETGTAELNISGRTVPGSYVAKSKKGGKQYTNMDLGMVKNEIWVDGENVWVLSNNELRTEEGTERDQKLFTAQLFYETKLIEAGYDCEVLGKNDEYIIMKCSSSGGEEKTYYYDAESFLLRKVESMDEGPQGPMSVTVEFDDYKKFGGVMLPTIRKNTNSMFTLETKTTYKINEKIEESVFQPKK
jgi:predicted Zn-dependent peptidase